jgi:hypothetical protein
LLRLQAKDIEAELAARNMEIRNLHLQLVKKGLHHQPIRQGGVADRSVSNNKNRGEGQAQPHSRSWSSIEAVEGSALTEVC